MKFMKRSLFMVMAALILAVNVAACGDDDDDDDNVVEPFTLSVGLDANTVNAVVGTSFSFNDVSGIFPELQGPTEITFTAADRISFANAAGTATGGVTFGSCTVTITNRGTTDLVVGTQRTINPCEISITSDGRVQLGGQGSGSVSFTFGIFNSDPVNVTLQVTEGGSITVNGQTVGNVSNITGSGGSGG